MSETFRKRKKKRTWFNLNSEAQAGKIGRCQPHINKILTSHIEFTESLPVPAPPSTNEAWPTKPRSLILDWTSRTESLADVCRQTWQPANVVCESSGSGGGPVEFWWARPNLGLVWAGLKNLRPGSAHCEACFTQLLDHIHCLPFLTLATLSSNYLRTKFPSSSSILYSAYTPEIWNLRNFQKRHKEKEPKSR